MTAPSLDIKFSDVLRVIDMVAPTIGLWSASQKLADMFLKVSLGLSI
jgi:hypothetical protein